MFVIVSYNYHLNNPSSWHQKHQMNISYIKKKYRVRKRVTKSERRVDIQQSSRYQTVYLRRKNTSGEEEGSAARALLPHKVQFILLAIAHAQLRLRTRGLRDKLALTYPARVGKEFLLHVLGDPLFNDDIVSVMLGHRSVW